MISKYNKFKTDKILDSINESFIYYSSKFRRMLIDLSDSSDIARYLLIVEMTDVKPDMTFIDISDKDGYISFSQIKKFSNILKKWIDENKVNSLINKDVVDDINNGDITKYEIDDLYNLAQSDKGLDIFTKSRNDTKIGKLVNSIFSSSTFNFSKKQVEDFVNKVKAYTLSGGNKWEIVDGDEIQKWYLEENHYKDSGSLGSSCMRYSSCSEYLKIYSDNKDTCRLLTLKNMDGKLLGRALIWKVSFENNDEIDAEYFIDRVYTTSEYLREDFFAYALKENYCIRENTGYSETSSIRYKNIVYNNIKMKVLLKAYEFYTYPYMDTFKRLNGDTLYNDDNCSSGSYILESTDGEFSNCDRKFSDYYDGYINDEDAIYSEPLRDWIYDSDSIEVKIGDNRGFYPSEYSYIFIDPYRDCYVSNSDSSYSEIDDCYFFSEDEVEVLVSFNNSHDYKLSKISNISSDITRISEIACEEYLDDNLVSIEYVYNEIIKYDAHTKKYYLTSHEIKVYINQGFSKIDSIIMGIDIKESAFYYTDTFAYNFSLDKVFLMKKAENKVKEYDSIIKGDNKMLDFEENSDYISKVIKRRDSILQRINELEDFD
jgi:hypothetical protein